eukprot:gene19043-20956_t
MHPMFKRAATNSPRSPNSEQSSPSNHVSKKFKTPMMFEPRVVPSPSRKELWKQELGLDVNDSDNDPSEVSSDDDQPESDQVDHSKGRHSNVEFDALELELERREKQKDALLARLKESSDKLKTYKVELEKSQQAKRNQLKIMKKTYEVHLSEKEECIQCLHELIEEQGEKIIELHSKLIGESTTDKDDDINTYRAVKKLVDKLTKAQQEKANLTASVMKAQARMTKLEDDKEEMSLKFEEEKEALEKQIRKYERETGDSNNNLVPSKEIKITIEGLEKEKKMLSEEIEKMEQELSDHKRKNLHWEKKFENEVSELRRSIRQTEDQLDQVNSAPPKVIVKTIVSEESQRQLQLLEKENRELKVEVAKATTELSIETSSLQKKILKLKSENEKLTSDLVEKVGSLEKVNSNLATLSRFKELYEDSQSKVASLNIQLNTTSENLRRMELESTKKTEELVKEMHQRVKNARLEAENKFSNVIQQYNNIRGNAFQLAESVTKIKEEFENIKLDMKSLASFIHPSMLAVQKAITESIAEIDNKNKILVSKYAKEMRLRKKLHNELVDLKGNIRVFCRVRPTIKEDGGGMNGENVIEFDEDDDGLLSVDHKGKMKQFEVDRVFKPSSTQLEVFNEVKSLVTCCIDGYNVCIFAYGQTGSGKTFTMEGTLQDPGINQRALSLLFTEISDRSDWVFRISVSMLEIYNESIRDLLATKGLPLDIKQCKEGVHVPGLQEIEVRNVDDVNNVFSLGHKNRSTASTNMNEHSSRSHAILVINIVGENINTATRTSGRLNLVDLAGSERVSKSGAEGARMKEAQSINKSLSALGDVIHALKNRNAHIPYRNTKLTYLLQDSLGGDSKTLMVVQVAPVRKNAPETFCSLDFAQRVKTVELGQATKRIESADRFNESSSTPKSRTPKKRT